MPLITNNALAIATVKELAQKKLLGVDIETYPLPAFRNDKKAGLCPFRSNIRLVSVAANTGSWVFDMQVVDKAVLQPLAAIPWVAHNAVFEYRHMRHHGYALPDVLHDTMLMARLIHHKPLALADLAKAELGLEVDKTQQKSDWSGELTAVQVAYAVLDAELALTLAVRLSKYLKAANLDQAYALYRKAVPVIGEQALYGIRFDWGEHSRQVQQWKQEADRLEQVIYDLIGEINLRSPQQLSGWLVQNLPAQVAARWPKTDKGLLKTDANTLGLHSDIPMVAPLLQYKLAQKLVSTYGTGYAKHRNPVTGRLHPDLYICGTRGGRFNCRNPNTQNPPRGAFRALFNTAAGRVLVAADYGQIEMRVAALLAQDKAMLQAYADGKDLHQVTASVIAGVPFEQVNKAQRQMAKPVNFGNLYQQRAKGLSRYAKQSYGVELSVDEAQAAQDKFFLTYPDILTWQQRQIIRARVYGKVATRLGMLRDFKLHTGYLEAEACNHPIQGTAAEVLLAALVRLPQALQGLDAHLVNHVHDELILDCAEVDSQAAANGLEDAMIGGFLEIFPEGEALTTGLVEVHIGPDWAAVK